MIYSPAKNNSMAAMYSRISTSFFVLFALGTGLAGLVMGGLGVMLALSGGSVFYAFSGALLIASAVQLLRRKISAVHITAFNFLATWVWAFFEVGLDGWALLPRVNFISVLLLLYALPPIFSRLRPSGKRPVFHVPAMAYPVAVIAVAGLAVAAVTFSPDSETGHALIADRSAGRALSRMVQDTGGARFSSLDQINRENAGGLQRLWEYSEPAADSTSPLPRGRDEAIPLEADGKLFVCKHDNTVLALDAADGHLIWRYDPQIDASGLEYGICRGVAYADVTGGAAGAPAGPQQCDRRIVLATQDARLIALDADTGIPCEGFGTGGQVSLRTGMGSYDAGHYKQTSPPLVMNGMAVIGGAVLDNYATGGPSGVIRAYDVRTGAFAWAWDLGRPNERGEPAAPETYARGTPNAWSLMSADPELGLVYVPTGNATPDFVGSYRDPLWEEFASSLVALDITSGEVRWSYQFVHHDLWDYDTSAQPVLFDMPTTQGAVPAVLQATKGGQLFVLDRRTGKPLTRVEERPVPQTDIPGEWTAKTQPFSTGMPDVAGPDLSGAAMWGLSPFDQMICRLKFHRLRYEGPFTPPSLQGTINYPSQMGGVDWGSVSIDRGRNLLIVPSTHLATVMTLVARNPNDSAENFTYPQGGTPFGANAGPMLTALGVPCQQPPYSTLTAIDLESRKVAWQRPLGTAEDLGPFGIASHLPFTIGAPPVVGGPITTSGDLIFIAAVGDRRLRAIDSLTGRELWSDKLPQGNQATPITYQLRQTGQQMVAIVSGGQASVTGVGDPVSFHVVAYGLR